MRSKRVKFRGNKIKFNILFHLFIHFSNIQITSERKLYTSTNKEKRSQRYCLFQTKYLPADQRQNCTSRGAKKATLGDSY